MELYTGALLVASANVIRLLVLDPRMVVAPIEPAEAVITLIPDDIPLDDLVVRGLRNRPELANAQELVEASIGALEQARLRPFVPSLAVSYAGGGFGGGQGSFFGDFGARGDVAASLFWELQNLGFGDAAIIHRRKAENQEALVQKVKVEAQVAADVVSAYETKQAAIRQIKTSRETVAEAFDSLKLNMINIRQGAELPRATRPIEVLQPIQALVQARSDYLDAVLGYNRAQFRLNRGNRPALNSSSKSPTLLSPGIVGKSSRRLRGSRVPTYLILNLVDRQLDVFIAPESDGYGTRQIFKAGDRAPLVIEGAEIGVIAVPELLP